MSSQTGRYWLGAVIGAALVAFAIWLGFANQPVSDDPVAEAPEVPAADILPEADVAEADPEVEVVDTQPIIEIAEVSAAPEAAEAEPVEEEVVVEAPQITPPSLDTFRVESDGQAVLAGRAEPGAVLDILVGGEVVERITADGSGSFFTFLDLEPSEGSRSLTVVADPDGTAVEMAQTYFIEPFGVEEEPVEIAEADLIPGAVAPVDAEDLPTEDTQAELAETEAEVATSEAVEEPVEVVEAETVDTAEAEVVVAENSDAEAPQDPIAPQTLIEDLTSADFANGRENEGTDLATSENVAEVAEEQIETEADLLDQVVDVATKDVPTDAEVGEPVETETAEASDAVDVETQEDVVAELVEPETTPEADESIVVSEAIEEIFGETLATEGDLPADDGVELALVDTEAVTQEEPAALDNPTVLVADEDGVRVVSSGSKPQALSEVALDTITYDPTGEVLLAGRASTDGFVQVYIDNKPITTSRITADLSWRTGLPEVDTGIYTLRIDEVDSEGEVVSRIETPFKREEAETVAAVMAEETAEEGFEVAVKTVQPGSTLWAIAREKYGSGILYVAVFEANTDLIRDPNLIYPGQIFVLPELDQVIEE